MQTEPSHISDLTQHYLTQRGQFLSQQLPHALTQGVQIAQQLSAMTDQWILALWEEAICEVLSPDDALVYALGGYGREQLCPGSDLDVLIELSDEAHLSNPELQPAIERWMTWVRQAKLKLGLATRTIAQGKAQLSMDLRTPIALLDARRIWGAPKLMHESIGQRAALSHLRAQDQGLGFVSQLRLGHQARGQRHGQTVYLLEPDLKSGLGALRDLNTLQWAAHVRFGLDIMTQLDEQQGWDEAMRSSYLEALSWLLGLRHQLHMRHERKHDRLHFADQEQLAQGKFDKAMPASEPTKLKELGEQVEVLMRAHYKHTRQGLSMAQRLLRRWSTHRPATMQPVNACFGQAGGQLHLSKDIELDASQVFDALEIAHERELMLEATLEQRMALAADRWGDEERADEALQARFLALLTHQGPDPHQGQRLLELGVLIGMMPEFAPLWCHVQHDLYHVYTTDQHTIYCLERARALLNDAPDEAKARWPMFAQLAKQIRQPRLLLLAALVHDIGKNRGGDHSRKGAQLVPVIGERLGLSDGEIERLAFLVREHLCLSRTSRRRDLSDVRVIRDLAAKIRSVETLNLLTALTFCDMSTVGPQVMNDWNAALLFQLYQRLKAFIEHGVEHLWQSMQQRVAQLRHQLHALLETQAPQSLAHMDLELRKEFLDEFLRDVPFQLIAGLEVGLLMRLFDTALRYGQTERTAMDIELDERTGVHTLIIATADKPGALAQQAGVLAASGLNILTAEIMTTASGCALNLFRVTPQAMSATGSLGAVAEPLSAARQQRLLELLWRVMDEGDDVAQLLEQRLSTSRLMPKHQPGVETSMEGLQSLSDDFTVLEIKTEDRPGLLYEIASTLHRCQLNTLFSKIDSLGNKIVDTFYVEDARASGKLSAARLSEVLDALSQTLKA